MGWISSQFQKSKKAGTGIYSWGKSAAAKTLVGSIPGVGNIATASLESLSESSDKYRAELKKASESDPQKSSEWYSSSGGGKGDNNMIILAGIALYLLMGM